MNDRRKNPEIPVAGGRRRYDLAPGMLLNVSETAAILGISEKLVRKLITNKALRCHRLGTDIRIHREHVYELLDTTEAT